MQVEQRVKFVATVGPLNRPISTLVVFGVVIKGNASDQPWKSQDPMGLTASEVCRLPYPRILCGGI